MAFGYDSAAGWLPATRPAILADLQGRYIAETTANVDVENGPVADMLRTVSGVLKDAWDDQLGAYNSRFVSAAPGSGGVAEGSSLELLLTPKIGPKLEAVASSVVLPCNGTPGTIIPAGHSVVLEGESIPWALDAQVQIGGGGTVDGTFSYSQTGPKKVVAGSTWEIVTPVTGWASVGPNAADAIPGRNVETDAEYRERYRQTLQNNVVGEVRRVAGVTSACLIEWKWGYPDATWGITHWFEVLVVGGSDADVAAAIQRERAEGTNTVGNTTVAIADPDYLGAVTIKYSRPSLVTAYAKITITKGEGYPADTSTAAARAAAIKAAVVEHVSSLQPGQDTSGFKVASYVNANAGIPGIDNIEALIDLVSPPVNSGTLAIALRDQLTITEDDVEVVGA